MRQSFYKDNIIQIDRMGKVFSRALVTSNVTSDVTEVRRESFGLVTERHHYNTRPIYACCCYVRPFLFFIVERGIARFL